MLVRRQCLWTHRHTWGSQQQESNQSQITACDLPNLWVTPLIFYLRKKHSVSEQMALLGDGTSLDSCRCRAFTQRAEKMTQHKLLPGKETQIEQVSPNKIHVFIDVLNLSDPASLFQSNIYVQAREWCYLDSFEVSQNCHVSCLAQSSGGADQPESSYNLQTI